MSAVHYQRDVIAVDLPGFGSSPPLPPDVTPTPSALAQALSDLLDELGLEQIHVVGNSLGGWVALEMARHRRARSVVGLSPAGLWSAPLLPPGGSARGRAHRVARELVRYFRSCCAAGARVVLRSRRSSPTPTRCLIRQRYEW